MKLLIYVFVLSLVPLYIALRKRRKILYAAIGINVLYMIQGFVLQCLPYRLNPLINYPLIILLTVFTVFSCIYVFVSSRKLLLGASSFAAALVLITAFICISPAVKPAVRDGDTYLGFYNKFTGINETLVYYYKADGIVFIKDNYDFAENYGIVLSDWRVIKDRDANEVYYYENGEIVKTVQNYKMK